VLGDAGLHRLLIAVPVSLPLAHRDDHVQRLAEHLGFRESEDSLTSLVPQDHRTAGVAHHDRVAGSGNELIQVYVRMQSRRSWKFIYVYSRQTACLLCNATI